MAGIQTGSKTFISLTDVPDSYATFGNFIVSVKGTENGLHFIPQSIVTPTTFISLTDCPGSYAGAGGKFVQVNIVENGLVFVYFGIVSLAADHIVVGGDYTIIMDASGGLRTVTIPDATTNIGRVLNIKKFDNTVNIVTLIPSVGGQTIEFGPNYNLTVKGQSVTIQSNGINWYVI